MLTIDVLLRVLDTQLFEILGFSMPFGCKVPTPKKIEVLSYMILNHLP